MRDDIFKVQGIRWVGRGGSAAWPLQFPDLYPLDLFSWEYLKKRTYRTEVQNMDDLKHNSASSGIAERRNFLTGVAKVGYISPNLIASQWTLLKLND